MNCAKCNRPLPIVKRRSEPGGEWVETAHYTSADDYTGNVFCGWPGCTVQEPSELRKALQNVVSAWELVCVEHGYDIEPEIRAAAKALAGDER